MLTLDEIRTRAKAAQELPSPATCRAIRKAAGLTIPEIAAAVGVTRQAVDHWEAGTRTPRGRNLERYIDVLNACRGSAQ